MAKIRGIKPDTWTDEKFVSVPPLARLLFIGMWNFCCDNGHIEGSALQVKMRILPADNCDVSELIDSLIEHGLVVPMGTYLKIPNLPIHQKVDKRFLTFCSQCEHDEDQAYTVEKRKRDPKSAPRVHDENPTSTRRDHDDDGDGDGDGDGDNPPRPSDADASAELVDADVASELELIEPEPLPVPATPDSFETWWDVYDKRVGKGKANRKWKLAIKKRGVTPELLIDAAQKYIDHQKSIGKHPQFTKNPETWLNGEHWNDDLVPLSPGNDRRYPMTGASTTADQWDRWMAEAAEADAQDERSAS